MSCFQNHKGGSRMIKVWEVLICPRQLNIYIEKDTVILSKYGTSKVSTDKHSLSESIRYLGTINCKRYFSMLDMDQGSQS